MELSIFFTLMGHLHLEVATAQPQASLCLHLPE